MDNSPTRVDWNDLTPGYYMAIGSDQGSILCFQVIDHPTSGRVIWGLSLWRDKVAYRTLGIGLFDWLDDQPERVRYYHDTNRAE